MRRDRAALRVDLGWPIPKDSFVMSDHDKPLGDLQLEAELLRRRVKSLEESLRAIPPWAIPPDWPASGSRSSDDELLEIVTSREKQLVESFDGVPEELIAILPVAARMQPPRTLGTANASSGWYPQIERAGLLHLRDGFIGDNVVFDADRYYGFGRWWLGDGWGMYRDAQRVQRIDAGVSIAAWGGEAFQHFIIDVLPRLAAVIDLLEEPQFAHLKIVSHLEGAAFIRWFWRRLGLEDRVVQKPINSEEGWVIHADAALYPEFEPGLGVYGVYPRNLLRPLQHRLGLLARGDQDLVLYLHRGEQMLRSVANADDLLARIREVLSGTPYRLEVLESSGDFDADVATFARAKIIIGPHGGALANMAFARPGAHVIEFLPIYRLYQENKDPRPMYWGLAQAAGLHYWSVEPRNFDFDGCGMVVDGDELAQVIKAILGGRRGGE